jgi:hypothetical protein
LAVGEDQVIAKVEGDFGGDGRGGIAGDFGVSLSGGAAAGDECAVSP